MEEDRGRAEVGWEEGRSLERTERAWRRERREKREKNDRRECGESWERIRK